MVAPASTDPSSSQIAIYTGPAWRRWSPTDVEDRGLGGSETAAVRVAEGLSRRGYGVTIYGDVEDATLAGVDYRHHGHFDPEEPRMAVVSSRRPEVFDHPIRAARRVLWMHDADLGGELTPARAARIQRIVVLSEWHRRHVLRAHPCLAGRIVKVRNGIHLPWFAGPEQQRAPRVLHTSAPERGLDVLLEMWPRIRAAVPDAEFVHCHSPVYDTIAERTPHLADHRARIRELSDQRGVRHIEPQGQRTLAALMRRSRVWAHPSWHTPSGGPFYETSCIGAMEAQAAGCVVVAARWGALPETVEVGELIDLPGEGETPTGEWSERFALAIIAGLADGDLQAWGEVEGPRAASMLGWDGAADVFVGLCDPEAPPIGG